MNNQIRFEPIPEATSLNSLTDSELVALCKQQLPDEIAAYRELLRRYEGMVYGFCVKTIGSVQDAEEVAQDALLQVFHKIHQFEGRSEFKTWLYKIVHNYCRNRISKLARKRKVHEAYEEHLDKERSDNTSTPPKAKEAKERIQEALNHLKPKDKEIITYKFMLGMTLQEISETLDVGASAAKMRYYRAMEAFKAAYERTGNDAPTPIVPNEN